MIPTGSKDLEDALEMGMDWSLREGSDFPVPTYLFPLICPRLSVPTYLFPLIYSHLSGWTGRCEKGVVSPFILLPAPFIRLPSSRSVPSFRIPVPLFRLFVPLLLLFRISVPFF